MNPDANPGVERIGDPDRVPTRPSHRTQQYSDVVAGRQAPLPGYILMHAKVANPEEYEPFTIAAAKAMKIMAADIWFVEAPAPRWKASPAPESCCQGRRCGRPRPAGQLVSSPAWVHRFVPDDPAAAEQRAERARADAEVWSARAEPRLTRGGGAAPASRRAGSRRRGAAAGNGDGGPGTARGPKDLGNGGVHREDPSARG